MSFRNVRASSQYLRIASAPVTAAPLTMACWFYPLDFTNFQVLMSINNSGANFNNFRFDFSANVAGDPVTATAWDSGGVSGGASSSGAGGTSAWYHGAAVYASTTSRTAYFNGGNSGTDTASHTPSGLNDTEIGSYRFGSGAPEAFFDGYIAVPTIWNVALSAAEVWKLARGENPLNVRPANIVSHLKSRRTFRDERGLVWTNNNGVTVNPLHPKIITRRRDVVAFVPAAPVAGAPSLIGGPLIRPNLIRGRLAA